MPSYVNSATRFINCSWWNATEIILSDKASEQRNTKTKAALVDCTEMEETQSAFSLLYDRTYIHRNYTEITLEMPTKMIFATRVALKTWTFAEKEPRLEICNYCVMIICARVTKRTRYPTIFLSAKKSEKWSILSRKEKIVPPKTRIRDGREYTETRHFI